ncbi:MAG: thioesterase family protein [Pseudolysinimonas sp.]
MRLHVPIKLRWSDLDAYGHVNNAAMLTLFEEVRIAVFWHGDLNIEGVSDVTPGAEGGTLSLIAGQQVEYLAPIPYLREPLDIQMWVGRLGGASCDVCYEVWSPVGTEPAVLYARASSAIVLVDAATMKPRRITDGERAAWEQYLEAPVEFTQRR